MTTGADAAVATIIRTNLQRFGCKDLLVTAKRWDGKVLVSDPISLVELLVNPKQPEFKSDHRISIFEGEKLIGEIHRLSFFFTKAPDVVTYIAYAFATDFGMLRDMPEDYASHSAGLVLRLFDGYNPDTNDTAKANKLYKNPSTISNPPQQQGNKSQYDHLTAC